MDRMILLDLALPGLAYAQMALLSVMLQESYLAANPVTVARALYRGGWSFIWTSLAATAVLVFLGTTLGKIFEMRDPNLAAFSLYVWWVACLYLTMVMLRRFGLFCFRKRLLDDWFPRVETADESD